MHMHMIMGLVLHTTVLAIVGYFILFSASKAQGIVSVIGNILGVWVFVIAVLMAVHAVMSPKPDGQPFGPGMNGPPPGWMMHHWGPPPAGPAPTPPNPGR